MKPRRCARRRILTIAFPMTIERRVARPYSAAMILISIL